ncbi:MAG TPA: hypothetical protein VIK74_07470 [Parasegetibacter sp.]
MLTDLFLTLLFGPMVLVSLVFLVFGIWKKRKSTIIIASIFVLAGVAGCAYLIWNLGTGVYRYVTSEEYLEDAKKGAEIVGKTAGVVSSGISKGLSKTLDDEAIANLAKKSAVIIDKSIKSNFQSADSTLGNKNIFIDKNLIEAGIELGRAEEYFNSQKNAIGISIKYNKPFNGNLKLTSYDTSGNKIETTVKEITAPAGLEGVEVFTFNDIDLASSAYYILSLTK